MIPCVVRFQGKNHISKQFSKENDVVIFVSGTKSSNGKMLYSTCKKENPNTYFISDTDEIKKDWFKKC